MDTQANFLTKLAHVFKGVVVLSAMVVMFCGCPGDPPYPELSSSTTSITAENPIPVSVVFSSYVKNFDASDIVVTNGAVQGFAGSGSSYSFNVVPKSEGQVKVEVPAEAAKDTSGVYSTAATPLVRNFDGTRPQTNITWSAANPCSDSPIPVKVTFSESVSWFGASDLVVSNATVKDFAGSGTAFSFNLVPTADGTVSVQVPAGAAVDSAYNECIAAGPLSTTFDGTSPTVTLTSTVSDPTSASPIRVNVSFSEAVTGFDASQIVASNATVSGFSGSGAAYAFDLVPLSDGPVTAEVAQEGVSDAAGNLQKSAAAFSRVFDGTAPQVSIASDVAATTSQSPIPVTVSFSEPVSGFDAADLSVSNAQVSGFAGDGLAFAFDLVPQSEGAVTVDIAAGAAQDEAQNGNAAAATFSRTYEEEEEEAASITVAMTSDTGNPTTTFPIPVTVTFSEAVTGFAASDITVSNGAVGTFSGSGAEYTFDLVPADSGTVTADIASEVAVNASGTGNDAASKFTRAFVLETGAEAVAQVYEPGWMSGSTISATRAYAPLPVFFEGWESTPREEIAEYVWDFGDGAEAAYGFNAAHVYETPGTYTATLTVTHENGVASTDTVTIEVLESNGMTFYVDAELGDDANDGTGPGDQAWRTAARAFGGGYAGEPYQPGDRVLFNRGQVFPLEAGSVTATYWSYSQGYSFGAYGEGENPLIQLDGAASGYVFPNPRYFAHVAFSDLDFNLTSADGALGTMCQMTLDVSNVLFQRCNIQDFERAFLMQGRVSGAFFVDCTTNNSTNSQMYTTCSRVVMLNNHFDLSNNHLAYLEVVDKGVISGNTFSRPAFGRHALRLSGRTSPTTNNVVITNNAFTGWIQTGTTRYNWVLVHLAPNTPDFRIMTDVLFEGNVLENAETLLNIGNFQNLTVRRNYFGSVDTYQGRRIVIGSIHGYDTMPVQNLRITENTIAVAPSASGTTSVFSVLAYEGDAYDGLTCHTNIVIDKNVVSLAGGLSRVLWFEVDDAEQVAQVQTDNLIVYTDAETDQLFQAGGGFYSGGLLYTLEQWQDAASDSEGSQVYLSESMPVPGWAASAPAAYDLPIVVGYAGAFDTSGAGLREVRLWVREDDGEWQNTGLTSTGDYGYFSFEDGSAQAGSAYAFALQAVDNAGNASPAPSGSGHCETTFGL